MSTHACDKSSQPCLSEEKPEAFEVSFFTTIMQRGIALELSMNFWLKIMSNNMKMQHFFLFPKLKKQLRGILFNDDNEMLTALEQATEFHERRF